MKRLGLSYPLYEWGRVKKMAMALRMTGLILILSCLQASAAWTQSVTLTARNVSLHQVFKEINKQTNYQFFYNDAILQDAHKVDIDVKNASVEEVLNKCFSDLPVEYSIVDNAITVKAREEASNSSQAQQQKVKISGTVTDTNGSPIPGATVRAKGSTLGTVTNVDGQYTITVDNANVTLIYSFVGMKPQEVNLRGTTKMNVKLAEDVTQLQQVTVVNTGYQKISKERAAGAYVVVSPKDMPARMQSDIFDRIEGTVAGMTAYKGRIQIRGVSTLSGVSAPLYVVDGVPYEGKPEAINPDEIESVTVLKDATAASIYGARSANGVIVIVTKSGAAGPLRVNYSANVSFNPLPDREYMNLMSSKELVNFQKEMFNYNSGNYASIDPAKAMNDVYRILYERKAGNITEAQLEEQLDVYRNRDRTSQIMDEFVRKHAINQVHNLSFSGGSDLYRYNLSANYTRNNPYEKRYSSDRFGFNLKNTFNFTKWLRADINILGTSNNNENVGGFSGYSYLYGGRASYYMLRDENGQPTQWYSTKSQTEINRLKALGLQDETYRPIDEYGKTKSGNNSKYININLGTSIKLFDGFSVDLRYQQERTESYVYSFLSKDATSVKTQINDATKIDPATGLKTFYIPQGGQISETRGDMNSYTLRGQMNYMKKFNEKHEVQAIAGGERRRILTTSTNVYKYGYDPLSLNYKPIDELLLSNYVTGTEGLNKQFILSRAEAGFRNYETRFVSFFGNASYTYDKRLTASGSIRMDQSNLFGTDPKYQYKPLWSLGLMYVIFENKFNWIDRLAIRATNGINGNIAKESGPYLIENDLTALNYYTNEFQATISSPPNSGLRWEKTNTTNLGVDFRLFKNRFYGSVEYYIKDTKDLLASLPSDPTLGWSSLTVNYGSMTNKGVDISLTSNNLSSEDFQWTTTVNFNYNKNRLTRLENTSSTVYSYISSAQNRVGKPMGALYSIRYAGLDTLGRPNAYKNDSLRTRVNTDTKLTIEKLDYNGTSVPPYNAAMINTLRYKGLELSFMFVYYGGHVMRGVQAAYLNRYPELNYNNNMDRNVLNYWKKKGDELDPNKSPGYSPTATSSVTNLWDARDVNVMKGDFIKLREVTLSYALPTDLLKKYYFKGVRFNLQVSDVWRWQANKLNLDPESWSGTSLSPSRGSIQPPSFTLGLSLNF